MSARERREREAKLEVQRQARTAMNGLRQTLASQEGRAFLWWFYAKVCAVEDDHDDQGRRVAGIELARAAKLADFENWQAMREENERPKPGAHAEADDEDEEDQAA